MATESDQREYSPMDESIKLCKLRELPFDVRQLIYDQLFPPHSQLYLMASKRKLEWVRSPEDLPISLLLVDRFFHWEAGEYLYNRYLFNIVGPKHDCLRVYPRFEAVMRKYARQSVRIDAFGNGEHSDTCCISLQAGSQHIQVLNRRRRGKPTSVQQLRSNIKGSDEGDALLAFSRLLSQSFESRTHVHTRYWILSITAVVLAVFIALAWTG